MSFGNTATKTIKIAFATDTSKYRKGLKGAEATTGRFQTSMGKMARAAKFAFAAAASAASVYAVKMGVDGVKAAVDDEKASKQLALTLRNVTGATDKAIASTESWITKQQFAAGISDNDLRKGLQRLVRSTKDVTEAQKLGELATQIAAGTGKDYITVANALAKANDGQFNALKKLGITVGDNAENAKTLAAENKKLIKVQDELMLAQEESGVGSEEYNKALAKVEEQQAKVNAVTAEGVDWVGELDAEFAGSVQANAETYAGKLAILSEKVGEMKEAIGQALLPVLARFVDYISTKVVPELEAIRRGFNGEKGTDSLSSKVRTLAKDMGDAESPGENLGASLKRVADAMGNLISALVNPDMKTGTSNLDKIANALDKFANAIDRVAKAWNNPLFKAVRGLSWEINPLSKAGKLLGFANGGTVTGGQPIMVGERGAELFVPQGAGSIVKNSSLRTGNGGGNTVINLHGIIDAEGSRRAIEQLLQNSARRTGAINLAGARL